MEHFFHLLNTRHFGLLLAFSIQGDTFLIFLPNGKLRLYFLRTSLLEKDEHLSKPPCLIVLNLEVMIFLWKRSIPLEEKIFTIGIIFDLVLVRGAPLIEWSIGQFI